MIKRIYKVNEKAISTDKFRPIVKVGIPFYKIYQSFGSPISINSKSSNVTAYWKVVLDDESVFSVYDWQRDHSLFESVEENLFWCFASEDPSVVREALKVFDIYNVVKIFDERFGS